MINIKKLTDKDIGRQVVFNNTLSREEGVIDDFNDRWVFVRYGRNRNRHGTNAKNLFFKDGD